MFKRILIANRGEIAVRVIRACQELDIETVAVYSEADANALHVQLADQAVFIGPSDASESYLNKTAILNAARESGADAIHPGYGFLSEDADFAEQVSEAGLTWIGPMPETIRLVGDKDIARAAIAPSGIPMAKGSNPLASREEAIASAREVGYPVILKPVAGGGGKGMCVAHDEKDFATFSIIWSTSPKPNITLNIISNTPAISKCKSSQTTMAKSFTSANANVHCSGAIKNCSKNLPPSL